MGNIKKLYWPHQKGFTPCAICGDRLLYHDPVYIVLKGKPAHEWCVAKPQVREAGAGREQIA